MKVKSYNRFLIAAAFAVTALSFGSFLGTKTVSADDKKTTAFTDPTKAGKDFEVQGEYLGNGPDDAKIGVQIIALGGGKFDLVAYPGGLPGDGWSRGMPTIQAKGEWAGDAVVFKPADEENDGSGEWKDGGFTVYDGDNNTLFELAKTTRKRHVISTPSPPLLQSGRGLLAEAWESSATASPFVRGSDNYHHLNAGPVRSLF